MVSSLPRALTEIEYTDLKSNRCFSAVIFEYSIIKLKIPKWENLCEIKKNIPILEYLLTFSECYSIMELDERRCPE